MSVSGIAAAVVHHPPMIHSQAHRHHAIDHLELTVSDLEQSVKAVEKAGGRVVQGPYAFPGGRRFHFTDPSSNELGFWSEN
ncbi:VOC family protein [Nocardiopsis algeriensis]|uniref:VOC family protein n=1 Tax=Nocardiopsis algeriensis TaxID=1478215 RepID=UPI003B429EC0